MAQAERAVRLELGQRNEWDEEEMVQEVWTRAWGAYEKEVALAEEIEAQGGWFNWVGWFVEIAKNLRLDRQKRGGENKREMGVPVSIEWTTVYWELRRDGDGFWPVRQAELRLVDDRWWPPEELALWDETVTALRECVEKLPARWQRVLVQWGETPNDVTVARELGMTKEKARRSRRDGLPALRECLEAKGYTAQNRGRQPELGEWSFRTARRKGAGVARLAGQ